MPPPVPKLYVPILITGMLISGCANSIFSKYQDQTCVENCDDPNPARRVLFEQPVWQTLQMFFGEMLCFIPVLYGYIQRKYYPSRSASGVKLDDEETPVEESPLLGSSSIDGKAAPIDMRGWALLLMWIPAICDLTGTTLMMVGLLYTPVSIYQMTRGALVLWVGTFSVIFLKRRLWLYQWLSLVTVMLGVCIVGLSGSLAKDTGYPDAEGKSVINFVVRAISEGPEDLPKETTVFIGVLFILFAQLFTATQFVVEEKIMSVYTIPPLEAVGWEGFFGALSILILLPFLLAYKDLTPFFDLGRGWTQMVNSPEVLWSSVAIALSIATFNGCGLGVTRYVNATARSTADTCRTVGIWVVSLLLGWEKLTWPWTPMQLTGFALLVYGTFVFNDLYEPPQFLKPHPVELGARDALLPPAASDDERRAILARSSLEETATLPANLGGSGFDVVPPPVRG